jgi:hypothetical protein
MQAAMSLFGRLDDLAQSLRKAKAARDSDKKIELPDLDEQEILEDLHVQPLMQGVLPSGEVRIFGKYSESEINELMDWSGIFHEIARKDYKDYHVELQYLSELDQRILIRWQSEILFHLRLKLSHFRFRLNPGAPSKKLLYIDWLMTRHPLASKIRAERLFPGQDMPGLGIFNEIADFVFNLALGVGAKGAFNIPEYFHDAVLFHRQFRFYDPAREAFFRALIRDLRRHGARRISNALAEGRIRDQDGQEVHWVPGEMIHLIDPEFGDTIWSQDYFTRIVRHLKRIRFEMVE